MLVGLFLLPVVTHLPLPSYSGLDGRLRECGAVKIPLHWNIFSTAEQ